MTLTNRGDHGAGPIEVRGELFGEPQAARFDRKLAPGASGDVTLAFDTPPPKPGLHALTLVVEFPLEGSPDAAGNPPLASERAGLLLALGAKPAEAVRLGADPLRLDVRGSLVVRFESRDASAVRVRLRVLTARGLRAENEPATITVPAHGEATAAIPLVRAGAPRGTRQSLLLVAETEEGPLARSSLAVATVEVQQVPALVPRLRLPMLVLGLALLMLAAGHEAWKAARERPLDRA